MISWLILGGAVLIVSLIYSFFWNLTSEKLKNQNEKYDFLETKFIGLIDSKISNGIEFDEIDISLLISEMAKNKQKKGTIKDVVIERPYYSSGEWSVFITIKSGTWPISDKKENYLVYSISDLELNQLSEFNKHLFSKSITTDSSDRWT